MTLLASLILSCAPTKRSAYIHADFDIENLNNADKTYYLDTEYPERIQPGDELYISVASGNDEPNSFNQVSEIAMTELELLSYVIDNDGYLKLPYIGRHKLEGLTIDEAIDTLEAELSQFIYLPTVSIRYITSRVAILGEVNDPGLYVFNRKSVTIFQALAYAGDITPFGNRKKVMIVRQEGNSLQRKHVNLLNDEILTSYWYDIQPNDLIYVEPLGRKKWGMETFPWGLVFSVVGSVTLLMTFLLTVLY